VNARKLLEDLRGRDVRLEAGGNGRLLVNAPPGVITKEVRETLANHKPRLLALLRWEQIGEAGKERRGEHTPRAAPDDGRRFDAKPSRHPGYTSLYDPIEGEWHDFPTRDCYPSVVDLARRRRRGKGRAV
jgi:hypothetical protein